MTGQVLPTFIIRGRIKPHVRMTQRSKWVNPEAQQYLASQHAIGLQLKQQMRDYEMIPRRIPLALDITFYRDGGWHGCDLSNLVKSVEDAAQGIVFEDDRWVDVIAASRVQGDSDYTELRVMVCG